MHVRVHRQKNVNAKIKQSPLKYFPHSYINSPEINFFFFFFPEI